jgi:phosphatidylinositol alpha-1,6-mannosyltransferase
VTRTLWVTNDFPPRAGGIEQFVANLLARLDPAAVRVVTARWPGSGAHDDALAYPVDRVARRPLLPTPALVRSVRAAAAHHRADVVVFGASWPLGELAAHLDRPTFALTHGHEAGMARAGLGPLLRRIARNLDAVGVISAFTERALAPWMAPHTALHRLPPGVDTAAFHPGVDGRAVRQRHAIPLDVPLTVCIGRLVARKGQDVLVEAWSRVRAQVPGARLLLGGEGPLGPRLRARVRALGLDGAVMFAGTVTWQDLPHYHAAADVFAMPCRTRLRGLDVEGLGIVYLEAQASGVPVVAGRSGGAPEALVEGETGCVVDGADVTQVASAVAALLADPRRRRRYGAAGRAFVEQRYGWPVISERLAGILAQLACR